MRLELRCLLLGAASLSAAVTASAADTTFHIVTLDPGHFHASLVHRESYPEVDPLVHVYAPLGPDLADHLKRVARFNQRPADPTHWRVEVHASDDFLARMARDKAGNVVVISGRNRPKMDAVRASVEAGFHALVDKPWILRAEDLPQLQETLVLARKKGLIAYDMMTERFEVTTQVQRDLVGDALVFGRLETGSAERPGVVMESVHHLMKTVAGAPLTRPAWFFDVEQQGEALSDVGTHLVDLVPWTLWPEQGVDVKDVEVLGAQRWPTVIPRAEFRRVTGEADFPPELAKDVHNDALDFFANTLVTYRIRGVHVKLGVLWAWEAPAAAGAGDSHYAVYRGSRSRVEVRQGIAEGYRPETYVVANEAREHADVLAAVKKRLAALQDRYPGVEAEDKRTEVKIRIPDRLRTSHEDHFAQVARQFFAYAKNPSSLPKWETTNMVSKYFVTTKGTVVSKAASVKAAERLAPR